MIDNLRSHYNMVMKELKLRNGEHSLQPSLNKPLYNVPRENGIINKFLKDTNEIEEIHHADLVKTIKFYRNEFKTIV